MKNTVQTKLKMVKCDLKSQMDSFHKCESGATAIEYALIASATGLALIAALPAISTGIGSSYGKFAQWFADLS